MLEIHTSSSLGVFKPSLLKYLHFPTRNYLFILGIVQRQSHTLIFNLVSTSLRLNFSALKYHFFSRKFVVHHQPVFFAMHLLKILNTIFCTAQVLLLCVKSLVFASAAQLFGKRWHCASDKKEKLIGS